VDVHIRLRSSHDALLEERVVDFAKFEHPKLASRLEHAVSLTEHGGQGCAISNPESDRVHVDGALSDMWREALSVAVGKGDLGCCNDRSIPGKRVWETPTIIVHRLSSPFPTLHQHPLVQIHDLHLHIPIPELLPRPI